MQQANLCRHLQSIAQLTPKALAVAVQKHHRGAFFYDEIDFASLEQKSNEIVYALNHYGIQRGMKAVLMVTPSIDFFALTFALFKAGIVPILVDPGMGIKNLKQCFIESSPDVFIGIPKAQLARKILGWGKNTVRFSITVSPQKNTFLANLFTHCLADITLSQLLKRCAGKVNETITELDENEMAAILFTSGSTGSPKGVVYSHKMFEAQISALKHDYEIQPGERDLATFPLFSLFGPALGMASIIPDMDASQPIKANPDFIFAAIEKYQCSNLFANPALIEVLGQAGEQATHSSITHSFTKLATLKRVISAGAPATLPSIARFSRMLPTNTEVITSYGATESLPISKISSNALLATSEQTDQGAGICVGLPIKGVEIAIIAITDASIEQWHEQLALPVNTIGEIVVKGDMVSHSYYQRAEATTQAKIIDGQTIRHRMGDLGYLDEQGQLWMCGRKAHRVETCESAIEQVHTKDKSKTFYSIPCERIFNTHPQVKRTALVAVTINNKVQPLICVELLDALAHKQDNQQISKQGSQQAITLFNELSKIAEQYPQTQGINDFLIHPNFPVDIRHNAKIFREKLAIWAQNLQDKA